MRAAHWISAGLLAAALGAGSQLWLLQQETSSLADQLTWQQEEQRELLHLRAEQKRLVAAQPSPAEMERLRADRTALIRLRGEVEKLKASAVELEKAEREAEAASAAPPRSPPPPPNIILRIAVAEDGSLTMAGMPLTELDNLGQHFAGLTKGQRAEVRIQPPPSWPAVTSAEIKRRIDEVFRTSRNFAREQGFTCSVRLERPTGQ